MRRHLLAIGTVALFASSGCTNLSQLAHEAPAGDDFHALLANEYLAYATAESERYDWYDSEYFARKGLKAASGINVQPENPNDWDVPSDEYDRILRERRRVVALVNGPAREDYTAEVAHAQVLFDCWVEQVDEQWIAEGDPVCADQFEREMADIESKILLAKPAIPSEGNSKKKMASIEAEHTIFFGFDLAELGERGKAVIDDVTNMVKRMAGYSINVDGYTDTAGPAIYNQMLSKKRADNVAEALVEHGADASKITTRGHGETGLLIETDDEVIEKKNRRVEIRVQGKREGDEMTSTKAKMPEKEEVKDIPPAEPRVYDNIVELDAKKIEEPKNVQQEVEEEIAVEQSAPEQPAIPEASLVPASATVIEEVE